MHRSSKGCSLLYSQANVILQGVWSQVCMRSSRMLYCRGCGPKYACGQVGCYTAGGVVPSVHAVKQDVIL